MKKFNYWTWKSTIELWHLSVYFQFLEHMRNVMKNYHGVGLAAPQIGVPLQVFVAEMTQKQVDDYEKDVAKTREMKAFPLKVFINPTLKVDDYSVLKFPEGCLSTRGFNAEVPRAKAVRVSGLDAKGEPCTWEAKGWAARIAQHEMDHLRVRITLSLKKFKLLFFCHLRIRFFPGHVVHRQNGLYLVHMHRLARNKPKSGKNRAAILQ